MIFELTMKFFQFTIKMQSYIITQCAVWNPELNTNIPQVLLELLTIRTVEPLFENNNS